jgi:transcriptional regulator with XRE-family HTH domain
MTELEQLSGALKRRRQELGLSISRLARRVRTSAATISRYENGWSRFQVYTLQKLASALGCRLVLELEPLPAPARLPSDATGLRRLHRLFWDRRLQASDLRNYPQWVVRRVLELGNLADLRALIELMGRKALLRQAAGLRFSSAKTERFWSTLLEREGVKCTRKSFPGAARLSWPR